MRPARRRSPRRAASDPPTGRSRAARTRPAAGPQLGAPRGRTPPCRPAPRTTGWCAPRSVAWRTPTATPPGHRPLAHPARDRSNAAPGRTRWPECGPGRPGAARWARSERRQAAGPATVGCRASPSVAAPRRPGPVARTGPVSGQPGHGRRTAWATIRLGGRARAPSCPAVPSQRASRSRTAEWAAGARMPAARRVVARARCPPARPGPDVRVVCCRTSSASVAAGRRPGRRRGGPVGHTRRWSGLGRQARGGAVGWRPGRLAGFAACRQTRFGLLVRCAEEAAARGRPGCRPRGGWRRAEPRGRAGPCRIFAERRPWAHGRRRTVGDLAWRIRRLAKGPRSLVAVDHRRRPGPTRRRPRAAGRPAADGAWRRLPAAADRRGKARG